MNAMKTEFLCVLLLCGAVFTSPSQVGVHSCLCWDTPGHTPLGGQGLRSRLLVGTLRIILTRVSSAAPWLLWSCFSRICLNESMKFFFCFFFYKFFWLCWVFAAAPGLSLVLESGGYSLLRCMGFSWRWHLLLRSMGSRHTGFSRCNTDAHKLWVSGPRACSLQYL